MPSVWGRTPMLRRMISSAVGCDLMKRARSRPLEAVEHPRVSDPLDRATKPSSTAPSARRAASSRWWSSSRAAMSEPEEKSSSRRSAYARSCDSSLRLMICFGRTRQPPDLMQAFESGEIHVGKEEMEPAPLVVRRAAQDFVVGHEHVAAVRDAVAGEGHRGCVRKPHASGELPISDAHRVGPQVGRAQDRAIAVRQCAP